MPGINSFVFEVLGEIEQDDEGKLDLKKEIKVLEQMYMEELQPFGEKGYHLKKT